jgi:hypothetical protein
MRFNPAFSAEIHAEKARLESLWKPRIHMTVDIPQSADDLQAYAWTASDKAGYPITFNAMVFSDWANPRDVYSLLKGDAETGGLETKPADVLLHEYGHVVSFNLPERQQRAFGNALKSYLGVTDHTRKATQAMVHRLSPYGVVGGPFEAMAEAFVMLDKRPDHPAAQIAEKYVGKLRR